MQRFEWPIFRDFKEKTIVNEEIKEKMSAAPRITVHTVEGLAIALPSNEN